MSIAAAELVPLGEVLFACPLHARTAKRKIGGVHRLMTAPGAAWTCAYAVGPRSVEATRFAITRLSHGFTSMSSRRAFLRLGVKSGPFSAQGPFCIRRFLNRPSRGTP